MKRLLRPPIWPPLLVWLLAFATRLAHVLFLHAHDPLFAHPARDAHWHVEWARALALGIWEGEPFFRAPLYPFFLGGIFKLSGNEFLIPRLVQGAVGAGGCVLVWALGRKLAGPRVGLIAGVMAALYGPLIYLDGEFLVETLFLPLVAAALLLLMRAREAVNDASGGLHRWAAAGVVAGMATIVRPNLLLVAVGMVAWIAWELPSWRQRGPAIAAWLVLFLVPVAGVTAYNAARGGGFVPVASQGGVNFWIGNNAQTDGKTAASPPYRGGAIRLGSAYRDSVGYAARLEAERRMGRTLRADEVSGYWYGQGFEFMREQPGAWLGLTVKKAYFLVNAFELPSNRELYPMRAWSPVLAVSMWSRPLGFPFGLVFPLALVGLLMAWRWGGADRSMHRLLAIYLGLYAAGTVAFFVTARHRLPIVPVLVLYAALALSALPAAIRAVRRRTRFDRAVAVGVAVAFTGGAVLSNTTFFDVREYRRTEHRMNVAFAHFQERRYEEALDAYGVILSDEPRFVRARYNVGATYLAMKRPDAARQTLAATVEIDPDYTDAWVQLGRAHAELGDAEAARRALERALELDPDHTLAHYQLALSYRRAWKFDGYLRHLQRAHRSDPDFAPANLALAEWLVQQGRVEEARGHLKRAARINPDDPRLRRLMAAVGP